jgi:Zn-dependent protease
VAQVGLAMVAVAGLLAFVLVADRAHRVLGGAHKELQLLIVPGFVIGIFLHEAAHAFTVKAFGRRVNRCGIGWYWFSPVAFVDTSDMWLGSRRQRILVSLAGPYANLVLAGAASLIALAVSSDVAAACLWSLALPNLLAALTNLNPLLEFDGYHVLSDVLDRPNLRSAAMSWFGENFPAVLRDRQRLRNHTTDLLYGIGSALYVIGLAAVMIVLYRLTLQGIIGSLLPTGTAAALAWVFALTVSLLALTGLIAELWGRRLAQ